LHTILLLRPEFVGPATAIEAQEAFWRTGDFHFQYLPAGDFTWLDVPQLPTPSLNHLDAFLDYDINHLGVQPRKHVQSIAVHAAASSVAKYMLKVPSALFNSLVRRVTIIMFSISVRASCHVWRSHLGAAMDLLHKTWGMYLELRRREIILVLALTVREAPKTMEDRKKPPDCIPETVWALDGVYDAPKEE
jgi:hypothetical protein